MGENKHIEELDAFAKKYIKEIKVESPSKDFTANLMNILQQENSLLYKATPLISKKVWYIIFAGIIALFFIPFKQSEKSTPFLDKIDFSFFEKIEFPSLFEGVEFSFSTTTIYSFVFLALMVFIQVYMLKNHFDKRLES